VLERFLVDSTSLVGALLQVPGMESKRIDLLLLLLVVVTVAVSVVAVPCTLVAVSADQKKRSSVVLATNLFRSEHSVVDVDEGTAAKVDHLVDILHLLHFCSVQKDDSKEVMVD